MKETSAEAFRVKLVKLTGEANLDLTRCAALREYLDANAGLLSESGHTLAFGIARALVNHMGGVDDGGKTGWGTVEIVHREYKNVLAGLLDGDSNFMIRLLAERAALGWLHLQNAESNHIAARVAHDNHFISDRDFEHDERRLTMAQNRFLRACEALARARAMVAATELMNERRGKTAKPRLALVAGMEA